MAKIPGIETRPSRIQAGGIQGIETRPSRMLKAPVYGPPMPTLPPGPPTPEDVGGGGLARGEGVAPAPVERRRPLGPFEDAPYGAGGRPGGRIVPSVPFEPSDTGFNEPQTAFDRYTQGSLSGLYNFAVAPAARALARNTRAMPPWAQDQQSLEFIDTLGEEPYVDPARSNLEALTRLGGNVAGVVAAFPSTITGKGVQSAVGAVKPVADWLAKHKAPKSIQRLLHYAVGLPAAGVPAAGEAMATGEQTVLGALGEAAKSPVTFPIETAKAVPKLARGLKEGTPESIEAITPEAEQIAFTLGMMRAAPPKQAQARAQVPGRPVEQTQAILGRFQATKEAVRATTARGRALKPEEVTDAVSREETGPEAPGPKPPSRPVDVQPAPESPGETKEQVKKPAGEAPPELAQLRESLQRSEMELTAREADLATSKRRLTGATQDQAGAYTERVTDLTGEIEGIRDYQKNLKDAIAKAEKSYEKPETKRKGPAEDARVVRLVKLAEERAGDAKRLRDIEQRLRAVAASQSLGRGSGKGLSPEQEAVVQQAVGAANRVAEMAGKAEAKPEPPTVEAKPKVPAAKGAEGAEGKAEAEVTKPAVVHTSIPKVLRGQTFYDWGKRGMRVPFAYKHKGRKRRVIDSDLLADLERIPTGNRRHLKAAKTLTDEVWPVKVRRGKFWTTTHYLAPKAIVAQTIKELGPLGVDPGIGFPFGANAVEPPQKPAQSIGGPASPLPRPPIRPKGAPSRGGRPAPGAAGDPAAPIQPAGATPREKIQRALRQNVTSITKGKPVRPKMIARFLTRELGVPIRARFANLAQRKAMGIYKVGGEVVRNAEANDLITTAHEVGHHIDKRYISGFGGHAVRKVVPKEAWTELVAAGKALYGDRKPVGGYASEGIAEYVRWRMMTDEAATQMPKFHKYFEGLLDKNPHLRRTLETAGTLAKEWIQQGAESRIESKIVRGKPKHETWGELASKTYAKLRIWVEDPGYAFKRLVKASGEKDLRPSQDPHQLYTFFQLTPEAKSMAWLTDAQFDARTGRVIGPSLQEILRPIVKAGRYEQWDRLQVARRTLAGTAKGRRMGFRATDAQYVVDKYGKDPMFQEATEAYQKFHDNVLEYAISSGALPKDVAAKMRKAWEGSYTPFVRVFPEQARGRSAGRGGGGIVRTGAAVKRFQEGGEEIMGAVEGSINKLIRVISIADKTRLSQSLRPFAGMEGMGKFIEKVDLPPEQIRIDLARIYDELQRIGVLDQIPEGAEVPENVQAAVTFYFGAKDYKGKDNIVPIFDKSGKVQFYEVEPELFRALNNMDAQHLPALLTETIGRATRLRRLGITGIKPGFQLVNIFKDSITFALFSEGPLLAAPVRLARGMWKTLAGKEAARRFRRLGGEMSTFHGIDRRNLRAASERAMASTATRKALHIGRHPIEFIREAFSVLELVPRVAEFETALKSARKKPGWTEEDATIHAFNAASDVTVNFRRIGVAMRPINQMFAYANPSVQGIRTFVSKVGQHPVRVLSRGLALTSMGLGYWWHVKDKDWWLGQPEWLKWGFWSMKVGDEVVRLPVPHEIGHVFYSLPIGMIDSFYRQDPKSVTAAMKVMLETDMPPGIPTSFDTDGVLNSLSDLSLVGPWVELAANKKGFTGAPIVPRSRQGLVPELQYRRYTTKLAKKAGAKLGVSPAKLEHVAEQLTGGLATGITRTFERGLGETAADLPVIGRFFVRHPWINREVIDRYYRLSQGLAARVQSQKKATAGDPEIKLARDELRQHEFFKVANKTIRVLRKRQTTLKLDDPKRKALDRQIEEKMRWALDAGKPVKKAG